MQTGEHDALRCHRLQIVLVALTKFRANLVLGPRHIVNGSFHGDDAFQVEAVDVVDGADSDFGVGVLHDAFNCVSTLANDASDQIVVGQDLQNDFTTSDGKKTNALANVLIHLNVPKSTRYAALTPC